MENRNVKKKSKNAWVALMVSLFFWVPLLNVIIFLPLAIFLSSKQMVLARKRPDRYGGFVLSMLVLLHASISFIFSLRVLLMSYYGIL
ncbi:hypothetical protein GF336_06930 [Candidatus Woesearchaeota archaeon]|nr:hypothetical protein [Candidatus Woesearchaeota archaeon]